MAKRFTDTEKWNDPWYRKKLTLPLKCFWDYLNAKCDRAGVWRVDMDQANFFLNAEIDAAAALAAFGEERIKVLAAGCYWQLLGFISEQYGTLSKDCRAHRDVFSLIESHKSAIGYAYPMHRVSKGYAKGMHRVSIPLAKGMHRVSKKGGGRRGGFKDVAVEDVKLLRSKDVRSKDVRDVKGKVVGKGIRKTPRYDVLFDQELWPGYPRRLGKKDAQRHFHASVHNDTDVAMIRVALDNFKTHMRKEGREQDKIPYGSTWFNQWRDWIEYTGAEVKKPAPLPKAPEVLPREEDMVSQEDVRHLVSTLKGTKIR